MALQDLQTIPKAAGVRWQELYRPAVALLFIVLIMLFVNAYGVAGPNHVMLVAAAMIGGYMALNIGANDVANNVGPAVGSQAISLYTAILIAAVFEAAGALVAGGDVVGTIKSNIIDPARIGDQNTFIWLMTAALLAAALWLNTATALGAPVSTTHSIVGGVLGAGVAAGGMAIANWSKLGEIAASWVISPVLGGLIAAGFLYLIQRTVIYKSDRVAAAKRMVPLLVAIMAWAFTTYLLMKGLKQLWPMSLASAAGLGIIIASLIYFIVQPMIGRAAQRLGNDRSAINRLFTIPLIFAAALLSFAHGANDVANAVGPLAAISEAVKDAVVAEKAPIPLWVMVIGALGISLGLMLYGPKLIRTVGSEITELDQTRAFCIALAAAITVIVASQLGLPVSSTHIAVGGVFGVGFLREFLDVNYSLQIEEIRRHHQGTDRETVEQFLIRFEQSSLEEKDAMLKQIKQQAKESDQKMIKKRERRALRKLYRKQLVKRSILVKIVAAWLITVPASACLGALFYFTIRGMMLP